MSFKDRLNKSNPKHDKPPMDRPIIKTRTRPDLYKPSWGDFTISSPGLGASSATTISSTGSQTYTVPRYVDTLTVTMYGGGGGGGHAAAAGRGGGSNNGIGGGAGAKCVYKLNEMRPGSVITFSVGAGGLAGSGGNGRDGEASTLTHNGTTYTAGGGLGGKKSGCIGTVANCPVGSGGQSTNGSVSNTAGTSAGQPAHTSIGVGGASVGDSAGAGGSGSTNHSSQNNVAGGAGKVIIS